MTQYFGKYHGKVENNIDPEQRGRLMVSVAAVTGSGTLNWALPSVPYAGKGVGFWAIPPNGANVWVEYQAGDPDYPIWSGCFWALGEAPASPAVAQLVVLKTENCTLTLNDLPGIGGITIETKNGMKIKMGDMDIEITTGQGASIKLSGLKVAINNNALEVT